MKLGAYRPEELEIPYEVIVFQVLFKNVPPHSARMRLVLSEEEAGVQVQSTLFSPGVEVLTHHDPL